MDEHAGLFGELYSAIVDEPVIFDSPTEKWIVWPAAGEEHDPREAELAQRGILLPIPQ